jgi:hypothetical protein
LVFSGQRLKIESCRSARNLDIFVVPYKRGRLPLMSVQKDAHDHAFIQ